MDDRGKSLRSAWNRAGNQERACFIIELLAACDIHRRVFNTKAASRTDKLEEVGEVADWFELLSRQLHNPAQTGHGKMPRTDSHL